MIELYNITWGFHFVNETKAQVSNKVNFVLHVG